VCARNGRVDPFTWLGLGLTLTPTMDLQCRSVDAYMCIYLYTFYIYISYVTLVTMDLRRRSVRFLRLLLMYIGLHLDRYMSIHIYPYI